MKRVPISGDRAQATFSVDLSGVEYLMRLTWREDTRSAYLDISQADGTAIAMGQRVSPGGDLIPDLTDPAWVGGRLFAIGPDPYTRSDLGESVAILYVSDEEIAALVEQ